MTDSRRWVAVLGACLAGVLGPVGTQAQQGGLVLEVPASIEAAAYGNAPNLYSGASDLLFYAPALIGRTEGASGSFQLYGSEGTQATLSARGSVGLGEFALGLQYLRYESDGTAREPDLQSEAALSGDLGATELAASLGYAREVLGFDAGLVLKYIEQGFDDNEERAAALDIGLAREVGPLAVALSARNVGLELDLQDSLCTECGAFRDESDVATQVALGVTTEQFQVGELDMFLTSQVLRRRDGEIIPAGGFEISYWPVVGYTFRLRAGLQRVADDARSPFTFGAAFTGDALTIEYAFQSFDGEGDAHRFGLSFR